MKSAQQSAPYQPRFITVEGIDGAGKSTHLPFIRSFLENAGLEVVGSREPGGTALGEALRSLLLQQPMQARTEAMLMYAARHENLEQVIRPALARGAWVLCDRFADSSIAYQGGGRGLDAECLQQLGQMALGGVEPDLTLLFDVPLEVARERLSQGREAADKFEREQGDFFNAVRQRYLALAAQHPQRIRVLDARHSIAELEVELAQILDQTLQAAVLPAAD